MKISNLLKLIPVFALMFMMNVPNALAGGTNRDDNTSAEPGDKATTTREVTDPEHDRRKGTTKTDKLRTPANPQDRDSGSSGRDAGGTDNTGSGTGGTGTDSSGGGY